MRIDFRFAGDIDERRAGIAANLERIFCQKIDAALGNEQERYAQIQREIAARRGANDPLIQAEAQARGIAAGVLLQEIIGEMTDRAAVTGMLYGMKYAASAAIKNATTEMEFRAALEKVRALEHSI